jgi:anion-transporting  ArsA/GET3 family ATPase
MTSIRVDDILNDGTTSVILCCGTGGVGKTTTSAAIAVRAAELGKRVCLITIDPAARLGQAMGLQGLTNTPHVVEGISSNGTLDAMMLDAKSTFDDLVTRTTNPESAARILNNSFYRNISDSLSGTQEYMAMEKLTQLLADNEGRWDLMVVDTPPSRSALDFLDAPARLERFMNSRLLRILTFSGGGLAKIVNLGLSAFTSVIGKILGATVLDDLRDFVSAIDSILASFTQRTTETYEMLAQPTTAFVVVTTAEPQPILEAKYFIERLRKDGMRLAALVVNRVAPAHHQIFGVEIGQLSSTSQYLLATYQKQSRIRAVQDSLISQNSAISEIPRITVSDMGAAINDLSGLSRLSHAMNETRHG